MPAEAHLELAVDAAPTAGREARRAVARGGLVSHEQEATLLLLVSELVTNSVNHPGPGNERELGVEVGLVGDHVLIAVSDRGAQIIPRRERRSM